MLHDGPLTRARGSLVGVVGLHQLCRGTDLDKLDLYFKMYDVDGGGSISRQELLKYTIESLNASLTHTVPSGCFSTRPRVKALRGRSDLDGQETAAMKCLKQQPSMWLRERSLLKALHLP